MSEAVQQADARAGRLLEILELEQIEQNLFRANNEVRGKFRLFGGQVPGSSVARRIQDSRRPSRSLSAWLFSEGWQRGEARSL
jgi:acyl-CoA thioesterase